MFTKEEALDFIQTKLGVPKVEQRFCDERLNLLEDIATKIQTELPFQNFRLLSVPPEQRRRPTVEEIKADMLSGVGGLCYNLDVSCFFLLQAIGYKTALVQGTCTSSVMYPNNHIALTVSDVVKTGDKYLLEVGFGFPTYRAIDLSFEAESPEFRDSFIEYKYVKHEGKILRMHRKGCPVRSALKDKTGELHFWLGDWRRFYWVDLDSETTDLTHFDGYFDDVFTKPEASPFHNSLRSIGFPNKKAVMILLIVNQRTLIEDDNGTLVPSEIPGGDDGVIDTVRKLFPALPGQMVEDAMRNYRKTVST